MQKAGDGLKNIEDVRIWKYETVAVGVPGNRHQFAEAFPEAAETLQEGFEDSLQFFAFPKFNSKRISSTNMQERLHKEIRRRSRVVGIFPNLD